MQYLVIGGGGTGGSIAASMTQAGKDVTVIDRGEHLTSIRNSGLKMETTSKGNYTVFPLRAADMEDYLLQPDVIFVCVKDYSLEPIIPFMKRISGTNTIIIPLLNIYGTGARIQAKIPEVLVTDGCIYISAEIKGPGTILLSGDIFRVVFGVRRPEDYTHILEQVAADLESSDITAVLSENIQRDALQKFSYVSPMAACGAYYDINAGDAQREGIVRETFISLMREIETVAQAMGVDFSLDIVATNLAILDSLSPSASTSMQRDMRQDKKSEMDGLVFEVVRWGKKYGISVPTYEKIAAKFGFEY